MPLRRKTRLFPFSLDSEVTFERRGFLPNCFVYLLRKMGMIIVCYFDDFIFVDSCKDRLVENVSKATCVLNDLGLTISFEKSNLSAKKEINFLGLF